MQTSNLGSEFIFTRDRIGSLDIQDYYIVTEVELIDISKVFV